MKCLSKTRRIVAESLPGNLEEIPPAAIEKGGNWGEAEGILFALAQAVEQRDLNTAKHCERLAFMSVAMGMACQLKQDSLLTLFRGGYLHDVGKVGIPDTILLKPGRLTAREWAIMRSHPVRGEEICAHVESLGPVLSIIRHHHERWDGSGYPDGLRGKQIPLLARMLQVADIYDALTSPRPYKRIYTPKQALRILETEKSRGWRDPEIVDLFLRIHDDVICRITEYSHNAVENLEGMRSALGHLNEFVHTSEFPGLKANGAALVSAVQPRPANVSP